MNNTKQITEAGLFAAIIAVMIIGSFYIPVIGSVMGLFLPVPVVILTVKNRPILVVASTVVAIILSGFVVSILSSMTMGLTALLVGLPLGYAIKKKMSNMIALLIGTIGAAISFLVVFEILEITTGITLLQTIEESFTMSMDIQDGLTSAVERLGVNTTGSLEEAQKLLDEMLRLMKLILPAMMLMFSMFYTAANLVLSHQVLKRLRLEHIPIGPFENFKYPKHVAYGSVGMIFLSYFIGLSGLVDSELLSANFAYIFMTVFSINGMAVIFYYLKRRMGKVPAVLMIVLLLIIGLMNYIAFLGFFDVVMDLRKLEKTDKTDND